MSSIDVSYKENILEKYSVFTSQYLPIQLMIQPKSYKHFTRILKKCLVNQWLTMALMGGWLTDELRPELAEESTTKRET